MNEQEEPAPDEQASEIQDEQEQAYQEPQQAPPPPQHQQTAAPPLPPARIAPPNAPLPVVRTVSKPRADGTGYEVTETIESKRDYPIPSQMPTSLNFSTPAHQQRPQPTSTVPAMVRPTNVQDPTIDDRIFDGVSKDQLPKARYFERCHRDKDCSDWIVEVQRQRPDRWPLKKGKRFKRGPIGSVMLDTWPSIMEQVVERFGGGRYKLALRTKTSTGPGNTQESIMVDVSLDEYPPIDPKDETGEEEEEEEAPKVIQTPPESERVLELERKRKEKLAEAELEEVEADIEKKRRQREGDGSESSAILSELRANQDRMADFFKETVHAMTSKKADSGIAEFTPLIIGFLEKSSQARKEESEERRREEERREQQRKEELEQRRKDEEMREQRRREEREERRREEEKREQQRKEELEQRRKEEEMRQKELEQRRREELEERRREEEKRERERKDELEQRRREELEFRQKEEERRERVHAEQIQILNKLFESKEQNSQTQTTFLERIIEVISDKSKSEGEKHDRLMNAIIASRLEGGNREVEAFIKAMEMGKNQIVEAMRLTQEEGGEETPAAVDPQQGFWQNMGNVALAVVLSKLGGPNAGAAFPQPQLSALDQQQIASGMTPLSPPPQGIPVYPPMLPQPENMPIEAPPPPTGMGPMQVPQPPIPVPPAPNQMPQQAYPPQAQPQAQPQADGKQPLPPQPKIDAESMQRLRDRMDDVLESACNDIADETRDQEWIQQALDTLPKWFLDRMVAMMAANRPDMVVGLIRSASSVDKFARLNTLVTDPSKYQIFMNGLMELINSHREDREQKGFEVPQILSSAVPSQAPRGPEIPSPANKPPASTTGSPNAGDTGPAGGAPTPPVVIPPPPQSAPQEQTPES